MSTAQPLPSPAIVPLQPHEGCTHPPLAAGPAGSAADQRGRRRQRVRHFVRRLKQRRTERRAAYRAAADTMRGRMRKRKTTLAVSAAALGLSTGATALPSGAAIPAVTNLTETVPDPGKTRVRAGQLAVSEELKAALAEEEGVRLTVYRDVAGLPTVGVGHLIKAGENLRVGDRISYDRAIEFLERDLAEAEAVVKRLIGELPLFQHEFDALVDLAFNVGEGNLSPRESPQLNAAIAARDYEAIADELAYHNAAGRSARGLVYRSERRQAIFLDASYDDPRPAIVTPAGDVRA